MDKIDELSAKIEGYISTIEFPAEPEGLYAPIAYTLDEGGKRLRPLIVLMSYSLYKEEVNDEVLACAAAVELFHNFTLLHDDIMDNASVRRGKSSVHRKWGANAAILSGDAMVISAYKLLGKADDGVLRKIFEEFNKMALEVCEGQRYDMDFENREDVTLSDYREMIRLKTAVIFSAAAKIGAIAAGASAKDAQTLYNFGEELGMAFQLQDDYLDTYGTAEILGKQVGGDIAESKKTFLTVTAMEQAGGATRRAMLATFKDTTIPLEHKIGRVRTIYNSLDIPQITRGMIDEHLEKASAELDKLSVGEEKIAAFRAVIGRFKDRNK